jgi:hypothetical protein
VEKPLDEKLLDAFEYYYLENSALRLILTDRRVPGWEQRLHKLMSDRQMKGVVQKMFSGVRGALHDKNGPRKALEALLRVFPPDRNLN